MKETRDFLVPDYYPHFACKMGECRHPCCEGWPVSISMKNYFSLLGVSCPKPLRDKLDVSMHLCAQPTEDEYARFEPDWSGHCPLHMADGRCAIHAELGEDVLPDVCRLYPRGIRTEDSFELSCANSCERTLELFLDRSAPLTFIPCRLTVGIPPQAPRESFFETLGRGQTIRLSLIRLMQDRAYTIPERLFRLGQVLERLEPLLKEGETDRVDALLAEEYASVLADTPSGLIAPLTPDEEATRLTDGLDIVEGLVALLDSRSDSIRAAGEAALTYFTDPEAEGTPLFRYRRARDIFHTRFPGWSVFIEHMLVNHMFFMIFPFEDRPLSLHEECVALCAAYALLRFLYIGNLHQPMDDESFRTRLIDLSAVAFRLIEHTDFDRLSTRLLRRLGCTGQALLDFILL